VAARERLWLRVSVREDAGLGFLYPPVVLDERPARDQLIRLPLPPHHDEPRMTMHAAPATTPLRPAESPYPWPRTEHWADSWGLVLIARRAERSFVGH
jgi:hypothetical protein